MVAQGVVVSFATDTREGFPVAIDEQASDTQVLVRVQEIVVGACRETEEPRCKCAERGAFSSFVRPVDHMNAIGRGFRRGGIWTIKIDRTVGEVSESDQV